MSESKSDAGVWSWFILKKTHSAAADAEDGSKATKAHLGSENQFYYNSDLKRWLIRGEEHLVEEDAKINPPPKMGEHFKAQMVASASPNSPLEERFALAQRGVSFAAAGRGRGAAGLYAVTPGFEVAATTPRPQSGFVPPSVTFLKVPTEDGVGSGPKESLEKDYEEDTGLKAWFASEPQVPRGGPPVDSVPPHYFNLDTIEDTENPWKRVEGVDAANTAPDAMGVVSRGLPLPPMEASKRETHSTPLGASFETERYTRENDRVAQGSPFLAATPSGTALLFQDTPPVYATPMEGDTLVFSSNKPPFEPSSAINQTPLPPPIEFLDGSAQPPNPEASSPPHIAQQPIVGERGPNAHLISMDSGAGFYAMDFSDSPNNAFEKTESSLEVTYLFDSAADLVLTQTEAIVGSTSDAAVPLQASSPPQTTVMNEASGDRPTQHRIGKRIRSRFTTDHTYPESQWFASNGSTAVDDYTSSRQDGWIPYDLHAPVTSNKHEASQIKEGDRKLSFGNPSGGYAYLPTEMIPVLPKTIATHPSSNSIASFHQDYTQDAFSRAMGIVDTSGPNALNNADLEPCPTEDETDVQLAEDAVQVTAEFTEQLGEKLLSQVSALQSVCEGLKLQHSKLTVDYQTVWKEELQRLVHHIHSSQSSNELQSNVEAFYAELEMHFSHFEDICDEHESKLSSFLKEIETMMGMVVEYISDYPVDQLNLKQKALLETQEQLLGAIDLLANAEATISTYAHQIQLLQEMCKTYQRLLKNAENSVTQVIHQKDTMQMEMNKLQSTIYNVNEQLKLKSEQINTLSTQLNDNKSVSIELHASLQAKTDLLKSLEQEKENLQSTYDTACKEETNHLYHIDKLTDTLNGLVLQINNILYMRGLSIQDDYNEEYEPLKRLEAVMLHFYEVEEGHLELIRNKEEALNDLSVQLKESTLKTNDLLLKQETLEASETAMKLQIEELSLEKATKLNLIKSLEETIAQLKTQLEVATVNSNDKIEEVRKQCEDIFDHEMVNIRNAYGQKMMEMQTAHSASHAEVTNSLEEMQLKYTNSLQELEVVKAELGEQIKKSEELHQIIESNKALHNEEQSALQQKIAALEILVKENKELEIIKTQFNTAKMTLSSLFNIFEWLGNFISQKWDEAKVQPLILEENSLDSNKGEDSTDADSFTVSDIFSNEERRILLDVYHKMDYTLKVAITEGTKSQALLDTNQQLQQELQVAKETLKNDLDEEMRKTAAAEDSTKRNENTIKEKEGVIKDLKAEIQNLKTNLDRTVDTSLYEELNSNYQNILEDHNKLLWQSNETQKHYVYMEKQLDEQLQQNQSSLLQLQEFQGVTEQLEKTIASLRTELDVQKQEASEAAMINKRQINDMNETLFKYESESQDLRNVIAHLQFELEAARKAPPTLESLQNENRKLLAHNEEVSTKNQHLLSTIDAQSKHIEALEKDTRIVSNNVAVDSTDRNLLSPPSSYAVASKVENSFVDANSNYQQITPLKQQLPHASFQNESKPNILWKYLFRSYPDSETESSEITKGLRSASTLPNSEKHETFDGKTLEL